MKTKKRVALFPGRFQPLHKGHLNTMRQIKELGNYLLIGLGSTNQPISKFNPFTADEREQMIRNALGEWDEDEYGVVRLTDIGDNKKWVKHVCQEVMEFDMVFSNSPITRKLFKDAGFKVYSTYALTKISSSLIRELIYAEEEWEHMVPRSVKVIMATLNGVERIKLLIDEKMDLIKGDKVC